MKSRDCKQIWRALRPAISVVFEILVKKLRIEDTEAYQEMMRMNYETLRNFDGWFSHFTYVHFGFSQFLAIC